jgi:hypothetical protein
LRHEPLSGAKPVLTGQIAKRLSSDAGSSESQTPPLTEWNLYGKPCRIASMTGNLAAALFGLLLESKAVLF